MYFYCNIINYKATGSGHIAVKFTIMTLLEEVGSKYQCRHLLVSAFLPPLWGLAEHCDGQLKIYSFSALRIISSHRSLLPLLASHWHGMSVYNKQLCSPHFQQERGERRGVIFTIYCSTSMSYQLNFSIHKTAMLFTSISTSNPRRFNNYDFLDWRWITTIRSFSFIISAQVA